MKKKNKPPVKGDCRFCYEYQTEKFYNDLWREDTSIYHVYKVMLVDITKQNRFGFKGQHTFRTRALNFCQECGRILTRAGVKKMAAYV